MKQILTWLTLLAATVSIGVFAVAQSNATHANQTQGFGDGKVLTFRYKQNFDCIDQPHDDLNYNKIQAASDPGEMQTPICVVGTEPSINPPGQKGDPLKTTEPLYVIIPMFSVDNDKNPDDAISCKDVVPGTLCGRALGKTLIKLFGVIPEGFKANPKVFTQCPDEKLRPGTCTMHASRVDLGPVLAALGYIPPPKSNVFLPTPNHSHVVLDKDINIKPIWWQVIPVLVLNSKDWPPQDGSHGITSVADIRAAEAKKEAVEAPSNFFLFFSSYTSHEMSMN